MYRKEPEVRTIRRAFLAVFSLVAVVGVAALVSGCTTARIPLTKIDVPVPNIPMPDLSFLTNPIFHRGSENLGNLDWGQAFAAMHQRIAVEYPFTEWRGVDWDALGSTAKDEITRAQKRDDASAYYLAVRKYVYSIPDGNMRISPDKSLRNAYIGGSYGLAISELEDGRVVAHMVLADGPAARAGMRWGAEIIEWKGRPIKDALTDASVLWADIPPATAEGRRVWQRRLLVRAPIGEKARVSFKNEGEEKTLSSTLPAEDDHYQTLKDIPFDPETMSTLESPIQWRLLPGNFGYMRIFFEGPTWNTPYPALVFKKAIEGFVERSSKGLVLDLRGNGGGDDKLAAKFLGYFVEEPALYRDAAFYAPESKSFAVQPEAHIMVEPATPFFSVPLVVLIDSDTVNAGEGLARILQGRPNVKLVGISGTHGSFGAVGGDINLPQDITLSYPVGRSLDAQGAILVDSNAQGVGGVTPDVRVPLTLDLLRARFDSGKDILLNEALKVLAQIAP